MTLQLLPHSFTVCQVAEGTPVDMTIPYTFFSRTDDELSLVCPTEHTPSQTLNREDGWRGLKIVGILDFSLVGILAKIAGLLAQEGISIFAVSTYNTDYILLKETSLARAVETLRGEGYQIV